MASAGECGRVAPLVPVSVRRRGRTVREAVPATHGSLLGYLPGAEEGVSEVRGLTKQHISGHAH